MPYALFRYPPEDEFAVRKEVTNLEIRLTGRGKGIHRISLAECLYEAMYAERPLDVPRGTSAPRPPARSVTLQTPKARLVATSEGGALQSIQLLGEKWTRHKGTKEEAQVDLVAARLPKQRDPRKDIVFITRVASLFPMYRTFSLLEQLKGRLDIPAILFYPGTADGPAGLRFMGVMEAEHNYRPTIF